MTSFLDFNKDPANDIDTKPQQYHDFGGKGLRVQVYWTSDVWRDASLWSRSWSLLEGADKILRKYTLSLDMLPQKPVPAAHAPAREKLNREFEKTVGPHSSRVVKAKGKVAKSQAEAAGALIDDQGASAQGLVKFAGSIHIPMQGDPSVEALTDLRTSLGKIADETRLIVVFAPIEGGPDGYTVLRPEWLPWVIVDPRPVQDNPNTTLIHEIGHSTRLNHQQSSAGKATARNIMYPLDIEGLNQLWGWQVDTLYDSYWCDGRKPTNWWDKTNTVRLPEDHPFIWDEPA